MGLFMWKDSFKVGVAEIDQQHEMFLEHINDCIKFAPNCDNTVIIRDLIKNLKDYASMHFAFEEEKMRSCNYVEYANHVNQHRYFENQVMELGDAINKGVHEKVESIVVFMRDWLINHILEEDKKYASYISHKVD
jgi:hemerythrin-like metal-binding protein